MSAKRVDTNQPGLVALYRHAGCRVLHLHGLGKGAYAQFAKNRNGPVGLARLAYIKERVMFADLERVELNA